MGKVLGGGSSINVSTWSRGHRADWDFYASESGDPSWGYEAVLDLYRHRIEAWAGSPDPDYRGMRGMVQVQPAAEPSPFSFASPTFSTRSENCQFVPDEDSQRRVNARGAGGKVAVV
jgi:choline dehydrogenase-like flavoprotein